MTGPGRIASARLDAGGRVREGGVPGGRAARRTKGEFMAGGLGDSPGSRARCVSGEIRINRLNLGRYRIFPVKKITDCYAHNLRGGLRSSFVAM
jgi:hypothetical protein